MTIKQKYTVSEATEFLGFKSRSTINKHTKINGNNALSYEFDSQGNKIVPLLELERVFPEKYKQALQAQGDIKDTAYSIQKNEQVNTVENNRIITQTDIELAQATTAKEFLERQITEQQERIKLLEAIICDLKQDKEIYRNQIKAITDLRQPQPAPEPVQTVRKKILGIF